MKTAFWLLLWAVILIVSSKPTITLKPFSIVFASPYIPFAIFFLAISVSLFQIQCRIDGKNDAITKYYGLGFRDGSKLTVDELKRQINSPSVDIDSTQTKE